MRKLTESLTPKRRSEASFWHDQDSQDDRDFRNDGDGTDVGSSGIGPTESAIALAAAIGATVLTRSLMGKAWQHAFDREPPKNPASRSVAWKEALLWGGLSGAIIGMTRIVARRASSGAYRRLS